MKCPPPPLLPLQSCHSSMFVKENPHRKKMYCGGPARYPYKLHDFSVTIPSIKILMTAVSFLVQFACKMFSINL